MSGNYILDLDLDGMIDAGDGQVVSMNRSHCANSVHRGRRSHCDARNWAPVFIRRPIIFSTRVFLLDQCETTD